MRTDGKGIVCLTAVLAASAVLMAATAVPVSADGTNAETKVTNTVETSVIDISLTQSYVDEDGAEQKGTAGGTVMPGQKVSLIPTITNDGADCYVRVRLMSCVFEGGAVSDLASPLSSDCVYGMQKNWLQIGDYLYDTEILRHGESVKVFDGFAMPQDTGNEYAGTAFDVGVIAEAVQADFFMPDFGSENPWGALKTESCIREGYDYESLRIGSDSAASVTYQGGAEAFLTIPDDFFAHFAAMLPGGSYSGEVEVKNEFGEETELFFKTRVMQENELLEKLKLTITQVWSDGAEKLLYDGACHSKSLQEYISLGVYGQGESCYLRFTVHVPAELTNEFTLLDGMVEWYFKAEPYRPADSTDSETADDKEAKPVTTEDRISGSSSESRGGKTGDQANAAVWFVLAVSAAAAAAVTGAIIKKRGKSDGKGNQ